MCPFFVWFPVKVSDCGMKGKNLLSQLLQFVPIRVVFVKSGNKLFLQLQFGNVLVVVHANIAEGLKLFFGLDKFALQFGDGSILGKDSY